MLTFDDGWKIINFDSFKNNKKLKGGNNNLYASIFHVFIPENDLEKILVQLFPENNNGSILFKYISAIFPINDYLNGEYCLSFREVNTCILDEIESNEINSIHEVIDYLIDYDNNININIDDVLEILIDRYFQDFIISSYGDEYYIDSFENDKFFNNYTGNAENILTNGNIKQDFIEYMNNYFSDESNVNEYYIGIVLPILLLNQ